MQRKVVRLTFGVGVIFGLWVGCLMLGMRASAIEVNSGVTKVALAEKVEKKDMQVAAEEKKNDEQKKMSEAQKQAIKERCDAIRGSLKNVQKTDSRARVYLGSYYEEILTKYVVPLNVRLVENGLSNAELVENQNGLTEARKLFVDDFINYQQGLEELVGMDCKAEPEKFYERLEKVRSRRKTVEQDTLKLRSLISKHLKLAGELRSKL